MTPLNFPSSPSSTAFEYQPRTRVIFGNGGIEKLGRIAVELGGKQLLLVTDQGIVSAGHAGRARSLLEAEGLKVECFDQVEENPGTGCVYKCVAAATACGADLLVGLGGGSSMDTAKGCNFILTNGGEMKDYWGIGKARRPMLPLIAVPTTGGTGSECQSFALITDEQTHQKMACGDPKAAARVAILDPTLTLSQPPRVTACTGIDAVAHAVETAVTRKRTPLSMLFSREAFRLTMQGLPRVLKDPNDLEARGLMQLGAAWAGTAIENSMLGAAHSLANPLTARFGIVHGMAVGLVLPEVIRFNSADPGAAAAYSELMVVAGLLPSSRNGEPAPELLARHLESLLNLAGFPANLRDAGAVPDQMRALAEQASSQWTAQFNPRPVTPGDLEVIYHKAATRE